MTKDHGTPLSAQFVQVLNAVTTATATAVGGLSIVDLIKVITTNGQELTRYLHMVFEALLTGQKLVFGSDGYNFPTWKINFPTWKVIKLGRHKNLKELKKALRRAGCDITEWADGMLKHNGFKLASQATEIELINVSVAELGFAQDTTDRNIYTRAMGLGLDPCPAEVAPESILQALDHENRELVIAIRPIAAPKYGFSRFRVKRDKDIVWLNGVEARPDTHYEVHERWVFARRRLPDSRQV